MLKSTQHADPSNFFSYLILKNIYFNKRNMSNFSKRNRISTQKHVPYSHLSFAIKCNSPRLKISMKVFYRLKINHFTLVSILKTSPSNLRKYFNYLNSTPHQLANNRIEVARKHTKSSPFDLLL